MILFFFASKQYLLFLLNLNEQSFPYYNKQQSMELLGNIIGGIRKGTDKMMATENNPMDQQKPQPQPQSQNITNPPEIKINPRQINVTYSVGQFSKYAVQKQNQLSKLRQYVNKVVRQAIISHLQKIKNVMEFQKKTQQQAKNLQKQFRNLFNGNVQNMYKFLQDPVKQSVRQGGTSIKSMIKVFTARVLKMHNLAIVDGKLAQLKGIKYQKAIKTQSISYVPVNFHDNTYIKIGQSKIPIYTFLYNGEFKTKDQLLSMTPQQRQTIISMVRQFLVQKKIAFKQEQVKKIMAQHIQAQKASQ